MQKPMIPYLQKCIPCKHKPHTLTCAPSPNFIPETVAPTKRNILLDRTHSFTCVNMWRVVFLGVSSSSIANTNLVLRYMEMYMLLELQVQVEV